MKSLSDRKKKEKNKVAINICYRALNCSFFLCYISQLTSLWACQQRWWLYILLVLLIIKINRFECYWKNFDRSIKVDWGLRRINCDFMNVLIGWWVCLWSSVIGFGSASNKEGFAFVLLKESFAPRESYCKNSQSDFLPSKVSFARLNIQETPRAQDHTTLINHLITSTWT